MKSIPYWLPAFFLLISLAFGSSVAAQDCLSFQNILHCPVGQAGVELSTEGLQVMGLGVEGHDGVASRFAPTTHWQARLTSWLGPQTRARLSSISGGETTSEMHIEPMAAKHRVTATFTGSSELPSYSVLVYRKGRLEAALGGFYAGDPASSQNTSFYTEGIRFAPIGDPDDDDDEDDEEFEPDPHFSIASNGGCNWGLSFDGPVEISLPNGTEVIGDEIRLTEDVHGSGHYPYLGFESIEIRTSAEGFTVIEELAEGSQ